MRNREESGIVASKWYGYGNLVGYVSIVSEEVQNLKYLQGGNWKQQCSNSGSCGTIGGSWIQENLKLRLVELA
ncbi:hypothetical protein P8452_46425 [Trifolium repens]|nr:hypothetical protein P8452_46425 [Trifolium repens]